MPKHPPPEPITRKSNSLPNSMWERIDMFRHANRIRTEQEAVRALLDRALQVEEKKELSA